MVFKKHTSHLKKGTQNKPFIKEKLEKIKISRLSDDLRWDLKDIGKIEGKYVYKLKPGDDTYYHYIDDQGREQKKRIGSVLKNYPAFLDRYQKEMSKASQEGLLVTKTVERVEEAVLERVPENPFKDIVGEYDLRIPRKNLILKLSQDPIDIALKSTSRAWESESCERVGGMYGDPRDTKTCGFASDIKNNNAIAIIKEKNSEEWLGRWMVRWCEVTPGDFEARIDNLYAVSMPKIYQERAMKVLENVLTKALLREHPDEKCCVKYEYHGHSDTGHPHTGKVCYGVTELFTDEEDVKHYIVKSGNMIELIMERPDHVVNTRRFATPTDVFHFLVEKRKNRLTDVANDMRLISNTITPIKLSDLDKNYENKDDQVLGLDFDDSNFIITGTHQIIPFIYTTGTNLHDFDEDLSFGTYQVEKITNGAYKDKYVRIFYYDDSKFPDYEAWIVDDPSKKPELMYTPKPW